MDQAQFGFFYVDFAAHSGYIEMDPQAQPRYFHVDSIALSEYIQMVSRALKCFKADSSKHSWNIQINSKHSLDIFKHILHLFKWISARTVQIILSGFLNNM